MAAVGAAPTIRVHGPATAEEVAALVAVLAAAAGGTEGAEGGEGAAGADGRGSAWSSPHATLRTPVPRGPNAWRSSARP